LMVHDGSILARSVGDALFVLKYLPRPFKGRLPKRVPIRSYYQDYNRNNW
jgi:hypothetical protein